MMPFSQFLDYCLLGQRYGIIMRFPCITVKVFCLLSVTVNATARLAGRWAADRERPAPLKH